MGSGCSAAKEAADMILIDDNFESTMKAVMWGRNIFSNVKKFIQFQVSVNISTLIIVFLGTIILGESPFGTVNLLWINLIMDTFAALALATEVPHPSIIKSPPVKKGDNILTPVVWRQIYGVSLYIVVVMSILMVFGKVMWDFDYKQTDPLFPDQAQLKEGELPNYDKMKHYTVLFNTYVFMLIFNEINCRKVGSRQFNVFSNLFSNLFFPLVIAAVTAGQLLMVTIFSRTARMYYLTSQQIAASIIWGSTVLVVSAVLKLTPDNWIKKLPITIDENKQIDENDPLMRLYNK
jgi:Ca2+ transporting ATPase